MSEHANILEESTDFSFDNKEQKPFRAKKGKPPFKSRPGRHDRYEDEGKGLQSRPTKELDEDPPPLSDAPTGEIPRDVVEQARRIAAKKAEAS